MKSLFKKSSGYVARTMDKANTVQERYQAIGSPWTQNIRNPLPMHTLVLAALPVLPDPHAVIPVKKTIKTQAAGKTSVKVVEEKDYAINALGQSHYEQKGMSVDDVVTKLREKGFIAVRGTVAMALSQGRYFANIKSVQSTRPEGRKGRPTSRYFVAS